MPKHTWLMLLGEAWSAFNLVTSVCISVNTETHSYKQSNAVDLCNNMLHKQRYLMPEGINARVSRYYICWHN